MEGTPTLNGSKFSSTYSHAGSIYAFDPRNRLKELFFTVLEKQHQAAMESKPFSLFVASALVHYYVKESRSFHPENHYIITFDSDWQEVFGPSAFHVAELPEMLRRLLLRVDGPYPPDDQTEWPLKVFGALNTPEPGELIRRIIGARPTWGKRPNFGHHFKSASELQLIEGGVMCYPAKEFREVCGLTRKGYTLQQLQLAFVGVMRKIPQDEKLPWISPCVLRIPKTHAVSKLLGGTTFLSVHQVSAVVCLNLTVPKRSARLNGPDQNQNFLVSL